MKKGRRWEKEVADYKIPDTHAQLISCCSDSVRHPLVVDFENSVKKGMKFEIFFFPVSLSLCLSVSFCFFVMKKTKKNLDGGMINAVNRSLDAFRLSPVGVGFASLCDCYGHRTLHALSFPFHFCRLPTENLFADQHIYALNSAVVHQQI